MCQLYDLKDGQEFEISYTEKNIQFLIVKMITEIKNDYNHDKLYLHTA